ncbi:ABC transporter permease [Mycolicibacterium helvum]|uniref:ABC transporter permease n=1 Tax=Mycolicibacterium helvum TaxID=1534349 RepID=A0A7I7T1F8_9MYCO|nr:ABC transporter permease [Mycolicibacterium helvum]BBY62065.1 hypothetical protein MHEL_03080 [Mycolicibacterium helvum]
MTATARASEELLTERRRSYSEIALRATDWVMPVGTALLMAYFAVVTSQFMTFENLTAIATQNAHVFTVAVVAAMLLMAGYADLSVGSVMALAGVASGLAFLALGFVPGILVGLAVGLGAGLANGLFIGYWNFSPIVVTLGMLAAARGLAQFLAPGSLFGFPDAVGDFGSGTIAGISYLVLIAAIIIVVCMSVMTLLPVGRHIIATGVNRRAAYLSGVDVKRLILVLYAATGAAAGLAGVLQVARLNSAPSSSLGLSFEVTVLTAILLGGIAFTGGRGSIWRVVLGVWLIGMLNNGLTLMNVGVEVSGIVTGVVLIIAAALEAARSTIRARI